ncbi:MAG TPA: hypothetical protein VJL90_01280, partial [Pseudorhodoplanes sp.]|nr:hypothetical protein [Pseudorhodoplanes sp.]
MIGRQAAEPEQIGRDCDELDQKPGAERAASADDNRHRHEHDYAAIDAVIGELMAFNGPRGCKGHEPTFILHLRCGAHYIALRYRSIGDTALSDEDKELADADY